MEETERRLRELIQAAQWGKYIPDYDGGGYVCPWCEADVYLDAHYRDCAAALMMGWRVLGIV
jgi:hypothetical protein